MTKPFDPTKPVQTRYGRPARILCTDKKGGPPIIGLVTTLDGGEVVFSWWGNGWVYKDEYSKDDLVNIPTKQERWLNINMTFDFRQFIIGGVYDSKELADQGSQSRRIACVKVEWEE